MPAGALTEEDCTRANSAPDHLIRTGTFGLLSETTELESHKEDESRKSRTQRASEREFPRGVSWIHV